MKTTSHIHINNPKHGETKKVIIIVSLDCIRHTSVCYVQDNYHCK